MSFVGLNLASPLSLYSIPVVWATIIWPHGVKNMVLKQLGSYDNTSPRANIEDTEKSAINKDAIARAKRLSGAHQNGNETFPIWIAAVVLANVAGLPAKKVNIIAAAFIGSRVIFNDLYSNGTTSTVAACRTATWASGLAMSFYLIIESANKIRRLGA